MVDTGSVSDDQGRSRICLSLCDSLYTLIHVSTHRNLSYIYIAVGHGDASQVFLLGLFSAGSKLCDCSLRSSLGGLPAGVGVYLGVEYHDVDILAGSDYVIQSAETDVVSPSVSTEYPLRLLSQEVFLLQDILGGVTSACLKSSNQLVGSRAVGCAYCEGIVPLFDGSLHILVVRIGSESVQLVFQSVTDCSLSEQHTVSKLSRILEQRVGPCRTMSLCVDGVRSGGRGVTPDGGTSRCVGDVHSVAEQLSQQLRVRCLAASAAGSGELKQRLLELRSLHGVYFEFIDDILFLRKLYSVIEVLLLVLVRLEALHGDCLLLCGADIHAGAASGTVESGYCDGKLVLRHAEHLLHLHSLGCCSSLLLGHCNRTDTCMRAYIGADVTSDTLVGIPYGNIRSNAALLVCSGTGRGVTGLISLHNRYRNRVTLLSVYLCLYVLYEIDHFRSALADLLGQVVIRAVLPALGNVNLDVSGCAGIDSVMVHLNHIVALLCVGSGSRILHELDRRTQTAAPC